MNGRGRLAACIAMLACSTVLVALGVIGAVSDRVTGHEALAAFIAIMTAAAAGLWLREQRRQDRGKRP